MSVGILNNSTYSNIYNRKSSLSNFAPKSANNQKSNSTGHSTKTSMNRMEFEQRAENKKQSVVDQSISYAQQLSATRTKSKDASLQKKKLQYSFKKISSQIIRSKNSVSARKAVQSAKREIARLKRLKGSGEYDDEELQLAIDHAKSMEKVAKKKVSHLEQEEMVERHGKGLTGALEETEKKQEEKENENPEEELSEEELEYAGEGYDEAASEAYAGSNWIDDISGAVSESLEEYRYEMEIRMAELAEEFAVSAEELAEISQATAESSQDEMSDLVEEMSDDMSEMMEELDLNDLANSLFAPDPDMSEDDLKMLKIKHRTKEMKEIAEADKEYLKGIMEHEKAKADAGIVQGTAPSAVFKDNTENKITPMISMPGAAAASAGTPAPTISGGFSVSI